MEPWNTVDPYQLSTISTYLDFQVHLDISRLINRVPETAAEFLNQITKEGLI